jgi:threonine dehydrogenase-like Zn-dependent dehydrogenase
VSAAAREAARRFGASVCLDPGDAATGVPELTGGGAHLSIDAVGSAVTCAAAVAALRRRGRHVQVGLLPAAVDQPALPWERIIGYELAVLGSHGLAAHAYPGLLGLVSAGVLRPDRLIVDTIPLDAAPEALVAMGEPGRGGIRLIEP